MRLKDARIKKQMTQEQLEEKSGIPQATISALENGRISNPKYIIVAALAKALKIKIESLDFYCQ
jgi:transcriptional regulator with XRE-family HTH domain